MALRNVTVAGGGKVNKYMVDDVNRVAYEVQFSGSPATNDYKETQTTTPITDRNLLITLGVPGTEYANTQEAQAGGYIPPIEQSRQAAGLPPLGQQSPQQPATQITQEQYQVQPGETIEAYNARIAGLRGETPARGNQAGTQQATQPPQEQTYTVRAGDNLSTIAKRLGVQVTDLSGYRSGNPNLIYPGEVLNVRQPQGAGTRGQGTQGATGTPGTTGTTGTQGTGTQTGTVVADPLTKIGIADITTESPESIITKISTAFGLDTYTKPLAELDSKLAEDTAAINDNPWLSEGLRSKKITQLQAKYDIKKSGLIDTLKLQQDVVGKALDVYYKEKNMQQDLLFKQMDLKSRELDRQQQQANTEFDQRIDLERLELDERKLALERQKAATTAGSGTINIPGDTTGSLGLRASNLRSIVAKTGPAAQIFDKALSAASAQGKEATDAFLRSQYINNVLTGGERNDFNNVNNGIANYKAAIQFMEANPDLTTGYYKQTAEGFKPGLFMPKDPRYTTLLNLINQAEAPIRKATYGTALTGTEVSLAQNSLLNTSDDSANILLKLKQNSVIYENGLERNMANALGMPFVEKPVPVATAKKKGLLSDLNFKL